MKKKTVRARFLITYLLTVLGLTSACGQQNYENRRTKQEQNGVYSSFALQGGKRQYVNVDVDGFATLIADSSVVIENC